ncbi:uncharacterized protein A1O9_06078 [Exophiala aquamarina CBS 119918]|uniref:Elongator complex protein 6 n=1 Tax=Exophiala aquamarina CBS 119918 TaxID=1182545 RepID=A0A072PDH3_9EURO|nr:uncharacterized protein A1O9_06078 [Exophiala aquamarina CBS 119918]KEF58154.1 hypothetical protein A1O9_06078 [Exophiala aquamarina CBS 119918]
MSACLAPSNAHSQTLLTSTLSTPSPWLTLRFLYAAAYGLGEESPGDVAPRRSVGDQHSSSGSPVLFVSLFRPLALWREIGRKLGLDIVGLVRTGRIVYIDGLPSYGEPDSKALGPDVVPTKSTVRLKSLTLEDLDHTLNEGLRILSTPVIASSTSASASTRTTGAGAAHARVPTAAASPFAAAGEVMPVVIVDGIDFVLASQQPSVSALSLQSMLATLRAKSQSLVVTCSGDGPLLHNHDGVSASATRLEADHALFVTSMAHQSQWLFQLRGLDTGTANDVSGVVRVSRGGAEGDDHRDGGMSRGPRQEDLDDAEWLYQIKGDGSARVWGRGE